MLRKVQLISALPSLFAALKIAAPAAFLGAILAEYLGSGGDSTLGRALIAAQTQSDAPLLWYLALVSGAISGLGLPARRAGRPAGHAVDHRRRRPGGRAMTADRGPASPSRGRRPGRRRRRAARSAARCSPSRSPSSCWWRCGRCCSVVFDVSAFVGKSPLDVWQYLFADAPPRGVRPASLSAADARAASFGALGTTLVNAAIGFVAGHAGGHRDRRRVRALQAVRVRVHADRHAAALGAAGGHGAAAAARSSARASWASR